VRRHSIRDQKRVINLKVQDHNLMTAMRQGYMALQVMRQGRFSKKHQSQRVKPITRMRLARRGRQAVNDHLDAPVSGSAQAAMPKRANARRRRIIGNKKAPENPRLSFFA